MQDADDPLIVEVVQMQRDRMIIVVAAVIGIVFALGGLGTWSHHAGGGRNPGGLIFFVAPFAACMAIGYTVHAIVRHMRPGPAC
jgi:hypothetical protein